MNTRPAATTDLAEPSAGTIEQAESLPDHVVVGHRASELVGPAVVTVTDRFGDTGGLPDDLLAETCRRVAATGAEQLPDTDPGTAAAQQRTVRSTRYGQPARKPTGGVEADGG